MAKFTLRERPETGIDLPDLNTSPNHVGDQVLIIDRQLEDRHGNLAGTFVFWARLSNDSRKMTSWWRSRPPIT